ncbi:hypothetical protein MUK42_27294 [Musa troglodytarum]|uniref:Secreted protein n=1 Tax=Musa troglodytarum TaxID=320322 RepID=A0A9E7JW13_9LILI|nr:hypothetical protein MUK42_27294 [Musa troglodytarum]
MPTSLAVLLLLLFLAVPVVTAGVGRLEHRQYVTFRPRHRDRRSFKGGGAEVRGCKPRGFRPPPSAPSRYVNYNTLGSAMCDTRGHRRP